MTQKHYHNDYKKLLGLDESRTASEKLLDKTLSHRTNKGATLLQKQQQQQLGRKLVKKEQVNSAITQQQILQKICKAIFSKDNQKTIKGLNIMEKCLNNGQFSTKEIKHTKIIQIALKVINGLSGNMIEQFKISEIIIQILQKIINFLEDKNRQQIEEKKNYEKELQQKERSIESDKQYNRQQYINNQELQQKQHNQQQNFGQDESKLIKKLKLKILFLKLFTDDSFSFQKNMATLTNKIHQAFAQIPQTQSIQQAIEFIDSEILLQIFNLPQLSLLQWVQSSVIGFYKQLIKEYRDKLIQSKNYHLILAKYNNLLEKSQKKAGNSYQNNALNTQNNSRGGAYHVTQKIDAAQKWNSKQ